jgi:hypothetical protein
MRFRIRVSTKVAAVPAIKPHLPLTIIVTIWPEIM